MRCLPSGYPLASVPLLQLASRLLVSRAGATRSSAHPEPGPWGAVSLLELFRKDSHPFPNETK